MTKSLYLNDMYLKEFEAKVSSVKDGKFIILNQTAFYPKSGGVDCDTGYFMRNSERFNVVYTGKFNEDISHEVDIEGLQIGDKITGKIDWDRRYKLSRYHTAAHILSGAFYKNLGGIKITGNNITLEHGRIDFNMENFDRTLIEEQVKFSNEIVNADHKVETYYMSRSEVESNPALTKLAMGIPKNFKEVRIIDITGFDRQPDGGNHVKSTKEVGPIKIKKLVNKGNKNRRIYFTID